MPRGGAAPAQAMQSNNAAVDALGMADRGRREGAANIGIDTSEQLAARTMRERQHNPRPHGENTTRDRNNGGFTPGAGNIPYWYNNAPGDPVPYDYPTHAKDRFIIKEAVRDAAGKAGRAENGVMRVDPIGEEEYEMVAESKRLADLAKFDAYVETLIDPKLPGNMEWLMKIYPEYVQRRLQQTHTDYEYALRNHMIDLWGINTKDDLHFKYMVDQGIIKGPQMSTPAAPVDASYTPGAFSPWNHRQTGGSEEGMLNLPYYSSLRGRRPTEEQKPRWRVDRGGRSEPLSRGNNVEQIARGMYNRPPGAA